MARDTYKGPEGERASQSQFSLRSDPSLDFLKQGDFGEILARIFATMPARQEAPNPYATMPFGTQRPQLSPEQIEALAMQEAETQRQAIQAYAPQAQAEARRYMKDPYKAAVSAADAQRASDYANLSNYKAMNAANAAAGPGLSAAQIAMQGPSAVNQWAQLGAYKDFGVDPSEVARMTVNRRFRS
jgi:hypothetical protein